MLCQQLNEAEAKKFKEEKERLEYEEYLKIKDKIVVQEEGDTEFTEEQKQNSLTDFVNFIKEKRIVEFDAIASQFQMSSTEAVKRVEELLEQGQLQGFIDDRGKFMYISDSDLGNISDYIVSNGRCSLPDISKAFGDILKL